MIARLVALAVITSAATSQAALIQDRHGDLNLAPEWIEVFVDEFHNGGSPTTWGTRDGANPPYNDGSDWLSPVFGELTGRQTFWVPRNQPTFYLEGFQPPYPEEVLGDRGLTFHTLDVEAAAGANYVTIDPSNVPGRFAYSWTNGSRTVDLPVLPRHPEPSSAVLCLIGLAFVAKRRR